MNKTHRNGRDAKKDKARERELMIYTWMLQHAGERSERETEMHPWEEESYAS